MYHLVDRSPWPLYLSLSLFVLAINIVTWFAYIKYSTVGLVLGIILTTMTLTMWWTDVHIESSLMGKHTQEVEECRAIGVIIFIISEVSFFMTLFWGFLHSALNPSEVLGSSWPPVGIESLDTFGLPFLNLILLLSSGGFLTYAHEYIIAGNKQKGFIGLIITILLGLIFLLLQYVEFKGAPFSICDSVFGSIFFFLSGFHGLHVFIGLLFLFIALLRIHNFTSQHHIGLLAAIWYYHVVDVIYLFVFSLLYWWGLS